MTEQHATLQPSNSEEWSKLLDSYFTNPQIISSNDNVRNNSNLLTPEQSIEEQVELSLSKVDVINFNKPHNVHSPKPLRPINNQLILNDDEVGSADSKIKNLDSFSVIAPPVRPQSSIGRDQLHENSKDKETTEDPSPFSANYVYSGNSESKNNKTTILSHIRSPLNKPKLNVTVEPALNNKNLSLTDSGTKDDSEVSVDEDNGDLQSYSCDQCDHFFKRAHDLKRHIRSVHTKVKPFSCRKCTRAFSRADALKRHISRPGSICYSSDTRNIIGRFSSPNAGSRNSSNSSTPVTPFSNIPLAVSPLVRTPIIDSPIPPRSYGSSFPSPVYSGPNSLLHRKIMNSQMNESLDRRMNNRNIQHVYNRHGNVRNIERGPFIPNHAKQSNQFTQQPHFPRGIPNTYSPHIPLPINQPRHNGTKTQYVVDFPFSPPPSELEFHHQFPYGMPPTRNNPQLYQGMNSPPPNYQIMNNQPIFSGLDITNSNSNPNPQNINISNDLTFPPLLPNNNEFSFGF